jgi:hypothetical protein
LALDKADLFWTIGLTMMIYYMTDKNLFWTSIFLLIGSIILIVIEALGEWNKTEAEKRR